MDFRPSILADGTLDSRRGQFSGLPLNSGLLNLREQDVRPTNPRLVIHAYRAIGSSRTHMPSGSRTGCFSTPGFSSTVHLPHSVGSGGFEVNYFLAPGRGTMTGPTSPSSSLHDLNQSYQQDPYANFSHSHSSSPVNHAMVTLLDERKQPPPSGYQSARAFLDSMVHHKQHIYPI
jgi:hypothetical protein